MREELELNRAHWDEATRLHTSGNVYGVEDFRAGHCQLHRVEREEVGDVQGRRLLHLQCHLGLDTLQGIERTTNMSCQDSAQVTMCVQQGGGHCGNYTSLGIVDIAQGQVALLAGLDEAGQPLATKTPDTLAVGRGELPLLIADDGDIVVKPGAGR